MLHHGVWGMAAHCVWYGYFWVAHLEIALLQFDYLYYEVRYALLTRCVGWITHHFKCLESRKIWTCTITEMKMCFVEWLYISQFSVSWNGDWLFGCLNDRPGSLQNEYGSLCWLSIGYVKWISCILKQWQAWVLWQYDHIAV